MHACEAKYYEVVDLQAFNGNIKIVKNNNKEQMTRVGRKLLFVVSEVNFCTVLDIKWCKKSGAFSKF